MEHLYKLNKIKTQRAGRTRAHIKAAAGRIRLTVSRSNTGMYAQLVDDSKGVTIAAISTKNLPKADAKKPKADQAAMIGELIAEKGIKAGVKEVVFDRGSYAYHGRVKALAEGARKGGLVF